LFYLKANRSFALHRKTALLGIGKHFKLQILNVQKSDAAKVLLSSRAAARDMLKIVLLKSKQILRFAQEDSVNGHW
jgi:hypothetical protein